MCCCATCQTAPEWPLFWCRVAGFRRARPAARGLGCVKTPEALFGHGIFSHAGAISGYFVDSNRALPNLRDMSFVLSHSLGQYRPIAILIGGRVLSTPA